MSKLIELPWRVAREGDAAYKFERVTVIDKVGRVVCEIPNTHWTIQEAVGLAYLFISTARAHEERSERDA